MSKKSFFLYSVAIIFLFSCEQKQQFSSQWNYEKIKGYGKTNVHTYIFCGPVAEKLTQYYKVGTWTFYSPQNIKIAEGVFDAELSEINNHGGCSFNVYTNTMNPKKWKFWDSNGTPIPTNKRDLNYLLKYEINNN
ncbi:hypothetical protein C8N46_101199 [Kordia periserrulae]|uniref:Uncharacterized protein n=1 Tax=Kordia periserrulae TaxID=701523 RepID=A0A2T6C5K0_9FLAO|nr:hypothetical protein [Kordia periserrulae]PTX63598.1 hypothetical protein C8N46_101199 [Kordia periserrulae]